MKVNVFTGLLAGTLLVSPFSLQAGGFPESAGIRFGFPVNDAPDFRQVEAFADFNLPLQFELGTNWLVQTRFDVSAGWLEVDGTGAFIGSLGPSAILSRRGFPVSLDMGFNPTLMGRRSFPGRDFGMPFEFTSHAGLDWDVGRHFRLGYRFQHMSNGGLSSPNPGVNMHMFTISYRF